MPQVGPYLKPQKSTPRGSAGRTGGVPGDRERDSLNYPRAPLAGFWRRVGAVAFDFVLLFFLGRAVGWLLKDPLLAIGKPASTVSAIFVLAYFILGDGPVGKGRTLGKFLAGIRVVDYEGNAPGAGRAFLRNLILYPGIAISFFINPLVFDKSSYTQLNVANMMSGLPNFALLVGSTIAVVFNPFKQGLHDYAAKTFVIPSSRKGVTFEQVREIVGGQWKRYYLQAQLNGGATALIILALLVFMFFTSLKESRGADLYKTTRALTDEVFGRNVYVDMLILPESADPARLQDLDNATIHQFATDLYDEASSTTLRIALRLDRIGAWKGDPAELEEKSRRFARLHHQRVVGEIPAERLMPMSREEPDGPPPRPVQNLRGRPLIYDVLLRENVYLFFPNPVHTESVLDFELDFPPMEAWKPATRPTESTEAPEDSS